MPRSPLRSFLIILAVLGAAVLVSYYLEFRDQLLNRLIPTPGSLAGAPPRIGRAAPAFTLRTLDGETVSLNDYRGKPVMVNFWATWCVPCREEMPLMENAYRAHRGDGLVVLAVNMQESEMQARGFVKELGLTYPILLDPDAVVARRYRVTGLPMTFFIGRDGRLRSIVVGGMTQQVLDQRLALIMQ
jgi:cytochrome c biogenesis protein CcmG/thiol:disulfide interchange protein DsbE